MAARGVLPISAEIHAHTEAPRARASSLILLDLRGLVLRHVPNVDLAIVRRRGKEAPILTEAQRPGLPGLRRRSIAPSMPLSCVLIDSPDFDLAAEARGGGYAAVFGGAGVVAAELVGV